MEGRGRQIQLSQVRVVALIKIDPPAPPPADPEPAFDDMYH